MKNTNTARRFSTGSLSIRPATLFAIAALGFFFWNVATVCFRMAS